MGRNIPVLIAIIAVIGLLSVYFDRLGLHNEGASVAEFSIDYKNRASVKAGRMVYAENCASCHGKRLQGAPDWHRWHQDGSMPAPPLTEVGQSWHHPDILLFNMVKYGGQSDPESGFISKMPAYEEILSDQEIHDILAFIKSSWPANIQAGHDAMNKHFLGK